MSSPSSKALQRQQNGPGWIEREKAHLCPGHCDDKADCLSQLVKCF